MWGGVCSGWSEGSLWCRGAGMTVWGAGGGCSSGIRRGQQRAGSSDRKLRGCSWLPVYAGRAEADQTGVSQSPSTDRRSVFEDERERVERQERPRLAGAWGLGGARSPSLPPRIRRSFSLSLGPRDSPAQIRSTSALCSVWNQRGASIVSPISSWEVIVFQCESIQHDRVLGGTPSRRTFGGELHSPDH
ncbi:hypothetical protein chiPu_0004885 [Chiloscyllium punctatum]|uniref:Uncharacterized protein n=1 Tax=Chiloscyllium punctatum TaxID=137246 RepID=A0A401S7T7_CHIPU|nr:hypothetical protein [Chiloscyllium punctatum]